jgi:hypothetical protein
VLEHVRGFLNHRVEIEALWESVNQGLVLSVESFAPEKLPQQPRLGTEEPVASIDELYEAAEAGREELGRVLGGLVEELGPDDGMVLKLAPLKQQERALEKARDDYGKKVRERTGEEVPPGAGGDRKGASGRVC